MASTTDLEKEIATCEKHSQHLGILIGLLRTRPVDESMRLLSRLRLGKQVEDILLSYVIALS